MKITIFSMISGFYLISSAQAILPNKVRCHRDCLTIYSFCQGRPTSSMCQDVAGTYKNCYNTCMVDPYSFDQ